jgi:hypothetical protein
MQTRSPSQKEYTPVRSDYLKRNGVRQVGLQDADPAFQILEVGDRSFAESRFNHDFSRIPLHANSTHIPHLSRIRVEGTVSRDVQLKQKSISNYNMASAVQEIHSTAEHGLIGSEVPLPHLERIQRSFGGHVLEGVRAFIGGPAAEANKWLGSSAYATRESIAFKQSPDLHTAAHEAAHIVQQRSGLHLPGGIGQASDSYERNAVSVADAVVGGYSAEPLLEQYNKLHSMHPSQVQFEPEAGAASNVVDPCGALRDALANSMQVIELYQRFLAGRVRWNEVQSHLRTTGIAGQGVVGGGRNLPQIVQDAINEAERYHLEDIRHLGRLVAGLPSLIVGEGEFFNRQRATNEIERQNRLNLILIRKMYENACPDFPGTWAGYQQQIIPIGTRGSEQRSTIEPPRETRTAVAWVEIGNEHVLILATEVAGSRSLRFERWIDSEFKELALRTARSRQRSIPSVPNSAVTGLPSSVPSTAARM